MLVYPSTPISPGKQEVRKSIFGKIVVLVVGSKAACMQSRSTLDEKSKQNPIPCRPAVTPTIFGLSWFAVKVLLL